MTIKYTKEQLNKFDKDLLIELFLGMQGQMEELSRQTQALNDRMQLMMEQMVLFQKNRFGRSSEKMADSEQIRFMEVDGTIVFFNEAEAVCDLDAPEPDDLELKAPKKKKQPGKKAADIAGLTVKRIDHYLKEEELTAEFGENGWKQLPDAISRCYQFIPASVVIEEHHIGVYSSKLDEHMIKAPHPRNLLHGAVRPRAAGSHGDSRRAHGRMDMQYTPLEARVLDVALLLHAEHGGGNNSTFTTRVVTSSGTDTYSAMAAALCSLKGPRHGGANLMVMQMMQNIRENLHDQEDDEELEAYLKKLLHGEAFDRKGLIYGMGHAVYSLSDPREVVFKGYVEQLAHEKGRDKDLALYAKIERMAPQLIAEERKIFKGVSPNVDFYSGFVYDMLGIPMELYTPLFAVARIMGWSAHRIEELLSANKIIRPAYKSLGGTHDYIPRDAR